MTRTLRLLRLRHSALGVALALCLGVPHALLAWAGQQAPAAKAPAKAKAKGPVTHVAIGEIVSISDNSLVLSHGRGKAKKEDTFTLTSETKKTGEPAEGERAKVWYTETETPGLPGGTPGKAATRVMVLPKAKPKAKAKANPPA